MFRGAIRNRCEERLYKILFHLKLRGYENTILYTALYIFKVKILFKIVHDKK